MGNDENSYDHVRYFCLVFVLQGKTHKAQRLVAFACLPVQNDQREGLEAKPVCVELAVDACQLEDQVDDRDKRHVFCLKKLYEPSLVFLLTAVNLASKCKVEHSHSNGKGVDFIVILYLACSLEEEIDVGEPNGDEVDDDGDNRDDDIDITDLSEAIMLFGFVIGELVLPLLLEVIVLLVINWKILAEVLH